MQNTPTNHHRKWRLFFGFLLITLFLVGIIYLSILLDWQKIWIQAKQLFSSVESLRSFILGFGVWAPVAFFVIQVLQVVIAPIPGGATVVVSAYLFGTLGGLALSLAGAVTGSIIVFLLGRYWGRPLVMKLVGPSIYNKYIGVFDRKGLLLFIIFLLPFLPDDAVCALAGLSTISFRRFFILVLIGRLPSMFVTILITTGLLKGSLVLWVTIGIIVLLSLGIAYFYRSHIETWVLSKKTERN
ncbi:TVP38/TMEM64 family protein [Thermoflavimicrobium daqui]|jgi:uncharacterized membrane protein YdjX (TVP38/TMEM64 family)|uniref:TVP38/TMEM64 family membrane protein n=1 Tax=Thermoflavimicrobium daqui TaxID=2137476 RepID=A0A364K3E4_9BACL|nr:VTT domain-containing protein [Thermoflavimicrobium daqui]RAL23357.1 TVP38/TMEM64 family protein [Thermoflavimicrobium daqui]